LENLDDDVGDDDADDMDINGAWGSI